jgi:hypothetical protein
MTNNVNNNGIINKRMLRFQLKLFINLNYSLNKSIIKTNLIFSSFFQLFNEIILISNFIKK